MNGAPLKVIDCLRNAWPESVYVTDNGGKIPLHFACEYNAALNAVTFFLLRVWQESLVARPIWGKLPSHLACGSMGLNGCDPISYRCSSKAIKSKDTSDDSFHYILHACQNFGARTEPDNLGFLGICKPGSLNKSTKEASLHSRFLSGTL